MNSVDQFVADGAALVINHSGGKDSTAMLSYICETYPEAKKYVVFADTGFEHVKPVTAEEWARRSSVRFGLELNTVRNPNKNLLTMIRKRRMFPSPSCRQCTSDLKRGPVQTWIRRNVTEKNIVNCMGIRAEESSSRAKALPYRRLDSLSKAGRTVNEWLPIHDWSLRDVLSFSAARSLELHPVYEWAGGYLRRLSCRICIMMRDEEIRAVYQHDREAFDLVSELEQEIGFTMKPKQSLIQIAGLLNSESTKVT